MKMQKANQGELTQLCATLPEQISLHLWLRYVLDGNELEANWRWKLHIVVDEMTTAKELRESWGKIDEAREKLKSLQGSDPHLFSLSLMSKLTELKKTYS
jgi:4-alpha-glucanotransferase